MHKLLCVGRTYSRSTNLCRIEFHQYQITITEVLEMLYYGGMYVPTLPFPLKDLYLLHGGSHYWYPLFLCSLLYQSFQLMKFTPFVSLFVLQVHGLLDIMSWEIWKLDMWFYVVNSGLTVKENLTCCWPLSQRNRMCISMELVTAVLGDHGQRPREDYGIVPSSSAFTQKLIVYVVQNGSRIMGAITFQKIFMGRWNHISTLGCGWFLGSKSDVLSDSGQTITLWSYP